MSFRRQWGRTDQSSALANPSQRPPPSLPPPPPTRSFQTGIRAPLCGPLRQRRLESVEVAFGAEGWEVEVRVMAGIYD